MVEQTLGFQAEVSRLLQIVANSLYSDKQVFLRELISNASDACDRLRHLALTEPGLVADDPEFRIRIGADKEARTLVIDDNGIGMGEDELIDDLGTIARSGTAAFVDQLSGDAANDVALIGQFGVGFYSAFMVADRVEVVSRRAGQESAWRWASDGKGSFTVGEAEKAARGTTVTLHLRDGEDEFLDATRLRTIIRTYSDHIALPIVMAGEDGKDETVNAASALWTRPQAEITADQYREFYHHVAHAFDEPWATLHWHAEGMMEYAALLFIPTARPFDLFHPERHNRVKLYVRRVFITDHCDELTPPWLRFLRGVVDSEDLPLNVSREMLQTNPMVRRIRKGLVSRVLAALADKAENEPDAYRGFWENFGAVLKEGLYEDADHREALLGLARFHSTAGDGLTGLAEYVARKKEGQKAIYTITGDDLAALRRSPQLEGFAARDIEVLLLTDPVDEFWVAAVASYDELPFKSATRAGADLGDIPLVGDTAKEAAAEDVDAGRIDALIAMFKLALNDAVKDVRLSERLTDSAVCLVSDEGDVDIHLERLLKQHSQLDAPLPRILEINARHKLIAALAQQMGGNGRRETLEDAAWLLLDQARILEGEPLPDPVAFSRRLTELLSRGAGAA
jgi:molecular chaperone HtpG